MRKSNNKRTRILLSVTALILIVVLAAGATFSWMEGGNRGYVKGNEIVISAGSSLTMRQDGSPTSFITIPAGTLEEVSSADGRNFFFPMTDTTSKVTSNMTFREGTPADENTKYVSLDFQLESGVSATDVYLGAGTIVQCSNQNVMKALRMSFSTNDGKAPTVFKPNQMPGVSGITYSPITAITADGAATTTETATQAYGDYYYKGDDSTPIFKLAKGETLNVTLSIWLEGTEFNSDDVANAALSIYIDFTTTVDDLVKYNFVDNGHSRGDATQTYWVANKAENNTYDTMMYIYDVDAQRYYAMEKSADNDTDHTWTAYVPKSITNFYFRRYSIDIDQWWNEWEPDMSDIKTDPNGEHTFINICGNGTDEGENLAGCYGYWQDESDTIRVYFKNNVGWNNLKCYAWRTDGSYATDKWKIGEDSDDVGTDTWPGKILNYSHNDPTDGVAVYYIDLTRASEIAGIQFNNSNNGQQYQIDDSQYFFNGFATWYTSSSSNGKWIYTEEANSLIYPHIQ